MESVYLLVSDEHPFYHPICHQHRSLSLLLVLLIEKCKMILSAFFGGKFFWQKNPLVPVCLWPVSDHRGLSAAPLPRPPRGLSEGPCALGSEGGLWFTGVVWRSTSTCMCCLLDASRDGELIAFLAVGGTSPEGS